MYIYILIHHAVVMFVVWSPAIMLYDVCHVVPCHDRPCHHAVLMNVMNVSMIFACICLYMFD